MVKTAWPVIPRHIVQFEPRLERAFSSIPGDSDPRNPIKGFVVQGIR